MRNIRALKIRRIQYRIMMHLIRNNLPIHFGMSTLNRRRIKL